MKWDVQGKGGKGWWGGIKQKGVFWVVNHPHYNNQSNFKKNCSFLCLRPRGCFAIHVGTYVKRAKNVQKTQKRTTFFKNNQNNHFLIQHYRGAYTGNFGSF